MVKSPVFRPLESSFLARWDAWYPDAPPVGFLLRHAYPDRWLRVHAMPNAERHPSSGRHYAELLRRYNAVAEDVLRAGSECALLSVQECEIAPDQSHHTDIGLDYLADLGTLPDALWDEEEGVFGVPMCVRGAATVWRRGFFDALFSAAAEDRIKVLLVEQQRGQVFAPYDGGVDIIFANSWERDQARSRYQNWLSSRPDGL